MRPQRQRFDCERLHAPNPRCVKTLCPFIRIGYNEFAGAQSFTAAAPLAVVAGSFALMSF